MSADVRPLNWLDVYAVDIRQHFRLVDNRYTGMRECVFLCDCPHITVRDDSGDVIWEANHVRITEVDGQRIITAVG